MKTLQGLETFQVYREKRVVYSSNQCWKNVSAIKIEPSMLKNHIKIACSTSLKKAAFF